MTDAIESSQDTAINQADFLKLFMQELTYQDPLKPVDNREFMAQMAQFSLLQEAQSTNKYLQLLAGSTIGNQSLALLGRKVTIKGNMNEGTVNKIEFLPNSPPMIDVFVDGKNTSVELKDIVSVW